jgi:hypothetical protein
MGYIVILMHMAGSITETAAFNKIDQSSCKITPYIKKQLTKSNELLPAYSHSGKVNELS